MPVKIPRLLFLSIVPFSCFHAGRDDMIKIPDKYGIYHEEHTLPDTPHPFWFFHPWFEPAVNYTVHFLDKLFK
jgi:pectinesterase